jgi:16S rRNA (uracil1498-N3)-methyltransferase
MKAGDSVVLADGQGHLFVALITKAHEKRCEAEITGHPKLVERLPFTVTLGIAPTKSTDRFEWFLEKATEIGVDTVVPLICEHSERRMIKTDRMRKVLVAAMKQSLRAWLPVLDEPVAFLDYLARAPEGDRFICTSAAGAGRLLQHQYMAGRDAVLLIGPEGDFSETELRAAAASGFHPCSLGTARLRTETAGLVACHTIHLLNP